MVKAPKSKGETNITRISASDSSPKKVSKPAKVTKVKPAIDTKKHEATEKRIKKEGRKSRNPLRPVWRYLKGAWYELRQVRWPDRRATWGMTGALIAFTLFFLVVIVLLDYGFSQLFKLIMGSN